MIDLTKLSPAPWAFTYDGSSDWSFGQAFDPQEEGRVGTVWSKDDDWARAQLKFIALARNAFDVMMRRGWNAARDVQGRWFVQDVRCNPVHRPTEVQRWPDPFIALVEADKWYKEHVENAGYRRVEVVENPVLDDEAEQTNPVYKSPKPDQFRMP